MQATIPSNRTKVSLIFAPKGNVVVSSELWGDLTHCQREKSVRACECVYVCVRVWKEPFLLSLPLPPSVRPSTAALLLFSAFARPLSFAPPPPPNTERLCCWWWRRRGDGGRKRKTERLMERDSTEGAAALPLLFSRHLRRRSPQSPPPSRKHIANHAASLFLLPLPLSLVLFLVLWHQKRAAIQGKLPFRRPAAAT